MGESFQRLVGSSIRSWKRSRCCSSETENQYLVSRIPSSISIRSNSGHWRMNSRY